MAWYNAILGGGAGTSAHPLMNSTSTTSSTLAANQAGSITAVNSLGSAPYWATAQAQSTTIMSHQGAMYAIKSYADAIGWSLSHHHIPNGVTSDDPKIAMLKLTAIGEVLKDVGVRTSDTDYYIMREPSA